MRIHVLNGDALAEKFPFSEPMVICRECLIDGPIDADDEDTFWKQRAYFIGDEFESPAAHYNEFVKAEFDTLRRLTAGEVHLWFEHDLFCQTNLWFSMWFLDQHAPGATLHLVMPDPDNDPKWSGFGPMSQEALRTRFVERVRVNADDKQLGLALWNAFRTNDREKLERLSRTKSVCFPKLAEVCRAHLDRTNDNGLGRPQEKLRAIMQSGKTDFISIFQEFRATEGVYGFGDLQVQKLLKAMGRHNPLQTGV